MSKLDKIHGRIIKNHDEAFFFWEQLVAQSLLESPFKVTHIDAHTDLNGGYFSGDINYIIGDLLHLPIKMRLSKLERDKLGSANYLAYAIACGFISELNLVIHPKFDYSNLPTLYFKNNDRDSGFIEMKAYEKEKLYYNLEDLKPSNIDPLIPFQIIDKDKFQVKDKIDFLIFCQSPGYTPTTVDFMLEVIKDYIIEV